MSKISKFRDNQITPVTVPDHISDTDLSTAIDVLLQIGDVRVIAWIIENLDALKLSDGQIEALCEKRPPIKMRQVLARRIKSTAAANKLKTGNTSLSFRIEFLKNQHLSDECKKSCLTKGNIKFIIDDGRRYSDFNLENLKGKLPNQMWNWLDSQRAIKDIIT